MMHGQKYIISHKYVYTSDLKALLQNS